jgi:hypothetical protein
VPRRNRRVSGDCASSAERTYRINAVDQQTHFAALNLKNQYSNAADPCDPNVDAALK